MKIKKRGLYLPLMLALTVNVFANNVDEYNEFLKKVDVTMKKSTNEPQAVIQVEETEAQKKTREYNEKSEIERAKDGYLENSAEAAMKELEILLKMKKQELSKYSIKKYLFDFTYSKIGKKEKAYINEKLLTDAIEKLETDYTDSIKIANEIVKIEGLLEREHDTILARDLKQFISNLENSGEDGVEEIETEEDLKSTKTIALESGDRLSEKVMVEAIDNRNIVIGLYQKDKVKLKNILDKLRAKRKIEQIR